MSENEKLQRSAHQQRRRKVIRRLAVTAIVLAAMLLYTGARFIQTGGNKYISFTEEGSAIYKAYLKENEFYSEEYLNGSHAYVASLVDHMTVDFDYKLHTEDPAVDCNYSYRITAQLGVRDKNSSLAIFNPVYELKSSEGIVSSRESVSIQDGVELDYNAYNKTAKSFIAAYNLDEVEASLTVQMTVDTALESSSLAEGRQDSYTISVHIPLVQKTVAPYVETPAVSNEQILLAANSQDAGLYQTLTILFAAAELLVMIALAVYLIYTRDRHIDYARKVAKILSGYRSFIQKINNPFDAAQYQVLQVDSFPELLEIRDTLQSPILMYENEDQTCTEFFVLSSGIQYCYKICVGANRYSGKRSGKQAANA